jgi:dipeptidyl aminopeptidase/acylaminoacyl peptidase
MADKHIPTIDELIELPRPEDAQISPDGRYVAYVVKTADWEQNEHVPQVWLAEAQAAAAPRQLTFAGRGSWCPRWSPDGQWLAFLSKRAGNEHTQVYRLSPFGGEAERLTTLESDVSTIQWAPDGESIAFVAPDPPGEAQKKRTEQYGDYAVEDQDYTRSHLWLLPLTERTCEPFKLTSGDEYHVVEFEWHPGGRRVAFGAWPTPDERDWDRERLYTIDVETLEVAAITGEGCSSPHWSPAPEEGSPPYHSVSEPAGGCQIAFTRCGEPTYYANHELCIMPAEGGEARVLSAEFDEDVWLQAWRPNGLYFLAVQRTAIHLFRLDPDSGAWTRLTPDDPRGWAAEEVSISRDGSRVAMAACDALHYVEIVVLDTADGSLLRLTDLTAGLAGWRLGRSEVFSWTSTDGTPIEGVLIKPDDFNPANRYPLLVVIHGGPTATSLLCLLSSEQRYSYPIQQWLAKGALVLKPNYRGSAGYGRAFRALNVRDLGTGDYRDVVTGVDALIDRGWVDPERVGAMGWSQGGYISAFIATFSDRFKAVSVGAGISSWATYYVSTDVHPFTRQYLQATPWEDPAVYQKTSPITYIKQARTPTLIQHGEFDRRVPIWNAYELYQGLQDMGVQSKLVVYKGMPHGITKPRLNRQVMQENLDWFNRWLWGEVPETKAETPCYVVLGGEQRADGAGLPAIEHYTAPQVRDVQRRARRDGAGFAILSSRLGLLAEADPAPAEADEWRGEDASTVAVRLAGQIQERTLKKLVLYTPPIGEQPQALIALGCLQVAAGMVGGVVVEHVEVAGEGC